MRIFVTGANGQVGSEMPGAFAGHDIISGTRPDFDLTDERSVREAIVASRPDLVIHAGAYTDVDGCERDPYRAYQTNALGTRFVALAARDLGAPIVVISTDYVFDGTKGAPYYEWDEPRPLSVYGQSKLAGEREALSVHHQCYVARTSWVYSPRGRNFVNTMLRLGAQPREITVVDDEFGGPTLAKDLACAIASLARRQVFGIYHFSNAGECSRYELARRAIERAHFPATIRAISTADYLIANPLPARRPLRSTLINLAGSTIGIELRPWQDALDEFINCQLSKDV
ncbi:MAG TPA: dTDP-4-dehydrorhamnose reductase [Chloroflexota bacterium]|nr:dTDP-4-dehydrorhamnose reductase [Chloroflexota bacterium]